MAGHVASLSREEEAALATTPTEDLLGLDVVTAIGDDAQTAYIVTKRANHLRVQAAALAWNLRGARVNSRQPGRHRHRDVQGGGRVAVRRAHDGDAGRERHRAASGRPARSPTPWRS